MIRLENIDKTYHLGGNVIQVLFDVSLHIKKREMVAMMGPSGSGKSTTMNIIGLLDRPTSGHYFLREKEVSSLPPDTLAYTRNHSIGFIFQSFYLLSRLTALENVSLPLEYRDLSKEMIKSRAYDCLEKVGIAHLAHNKPNEMSGGQQQRVAIARAISTEPAILLADEPTGALDSHTGEEVMALLCQLNELDSTTLIIVTHDEKVSEHCQRIIRISDGRIVSSEGK